MLITIHQPDFIPWLGFFDRWNKSDLFIILDDVQFIRKGWQNRDKIKTPQGATWLTIPVKKKGKYLQKISEVEIDNEQTWQKKHLRTIEMAYKKAPNFESCFSSLQRIYEKNYLLMCEFNMELLMYMASELEITTQTTFSSRFRVEASSTEKILNLVRDGGGTEYLTGMGSKDYLDESIFQNQGIKVLWQKFGHPVYRQLHGEFVPMLSALDYLMMIPASKRFL